jgi:hypothetical protein
VSAHPSKPSVKSAVAEYLATHRPALISENELTALQRHVDTALSRPKPVSRSYLLAVLSGTDVEISHSLGGLPVDLRGRVHFATPDRAAESLLDLLGEYRKARAQGDRERADDCHRAVRQAKDRLRLTLRRPGLSEEKQREKQELLDWFLVWLETPELFDSWLTLRRRGGDHCHHPEG